MPVKVALQGCKGEGMDHGLRTSQDPCRPCWCQKTLCWCGCIPLLSRVSSRKTLQVSPVLLLGVLMGFPWEGSTLAYNRIWLKARTKTSCVLRSLLGTREVQQTMIREVVLVWATVSGGTYLLGENTYNYQTANRKPKIAAPKICPIKCYCNTSTQLSYLHGTQLKYKGLT